MPAVIDKPAEQISNAYQKMYFKPNCIKRGATDVPVILPNVELVETAVPGLAN
jgi:hypothetical protein